MLRTLDLRSSGPFDTVPQGMIPRAEVDVSVAVETARELIDDVRARGENALREQAERLDGGAPEHVRVPVEQIAAAVDALPGDVRKALETAIARVRRGSAAQVPPETVTEVGDGARITQRWQPV